MFYQLIAQENLTMSRIGKLPIPIPAGVTVTVSPTNLVTVKGKLGELTQQVDPKITIKIEGANLIVQRNSDERDDRSKHGLYRSLLFNMVKGVSEGYTIVQELIGVGLQGNGQGSASRPFTGLFPQYSD